jgi:hypothetical protein
MNKTEEANAEQHYLLLVVATIIGLVGVYFRFAADAASGHVSIYNWISNIVLIIGVAIMLKAVFAILK